MKNGDTTSQLNVGKVMFLLTVVTVVNTQLSWRTPQHSWFAGLSNNRLRGVIRSRATSQLDLSPIKWSMLLIPKHHFVTKVIKCWFFEHFHFHGMFAHLFGNTVFIFFSFRVTNLRPNIISVQHQGCATMSRMSLALCRRDKLAWVAGQMNMPESGRACHTAHWGGDTMQVRFF